MLKKIGTALLFILAMFCCCMGAIGIISADGDSFSRLLGIGFITFSSLCFAAVLFPLAKKIQQGGKSTENYRNPYVDMTPFVTGTGMPLVYYSGLQLRPGESLLYAAPANTCTEKEQIVGYTGRSAGVSVRVAKGLYLRQGASRGRPIRQDVKRFYPGDYIITNQRLLFLGPQKSFECLVEKVTAVKPIANDAFVIITGGKSLPVVVHQLETQYSLDLTNTALQGLQATNSRKESQN